MDDERLLGLSWRWRAAHWLWLWGLIVLCGFLTYWFSHSFFWWVDGFSNGQNIKDGSEATQAIYAQYGQGLGILLGLVRLAARAFWVGAVVFFAVMWLVVLLPLEHTFFMMLGGRNSAGGIAGWKRTKGLLAGSALSIPLLWFPVLIWMVFGYALISGFAEMSGNYAGHSPAFYLWMGIAITPVLSYHWIRNRVMERIGRLTRPVRQWWQQRGFGAGGAAAFGGMLEEWSLRYKSGSVLLGASLYRGKGRESIFKVGYDDDRGMMTISSARSGKGRSAIIPNLIEWPHSALVIDPKGTNAAVTAARRGHGGGRVTNYLGQDVHVLDPFGELEKVGIKTACFNPLSVLDIKSNRIVDDIRLVCEALVPPEKGNNAMYFVGGARAIIAGVIAHALTVADDNKWPEPPTLIDIRDFLTGSAKELDELFGAMQTNDRLGGLPKNGANRYEVAGEKERGGYMNTVAGSMDWLDSLPMAKVLAGASFDLADLKNGNTTIFLVLPPDMLEIHMRFLRLFVQLAIRVMSREPKAKKPVLFILDEFFSLGTMESVEKTASLLPSYKVKLWPILQNLGQLKGLYDNWETFFSGSGVVQIFAVNDQETGQYIVDTLGKTAYEMDIDERLQRVVASLLETQELEQTVAREAGVQIIKRSGARPLLLRRINYDGHYRKNMYSPDPDHPPTWWQNLNPYY
ncbi:MAG: type IV secretory system conjugative DNA transfer family protein [Chloroflexi bacterium]|nr:type IV secretory system conjugative DNA transfer family protein [Chloroflexota bacterium]